MGPPRVYSSSTPFPAQITRHRLTKASHLRSSTVLDGCAARPRCLTCVSTPGPASCCLSLSSSAPWCSWRTEAASTCIVTGKDKSAVQRPECMCRSSVVAAERGWWLAGMHGRCLCSVTAATARRCITLATGRANPRSGEAARAVLTHALTAPPALTPVIGGTAVLPRRAWRRAVQAPGTAGSGQPRRCGAARAGRTPRTCARCWRTAGLWWPATQ